MREVMLEIGHGNDAIGAKQLSSRSARERSRIVVDDDPGTGSRLKYFSRAADVQYWTELWNEQRDVSYHRAARGYLPHQLRATFRRWVAAGARTLEAGCGLGHFTVAAAALGYRAEGLDWSAATIAGLRRRFPAVPWHVGDARTLAFADDTFDAVYSPGVCEHFEEGPDVVLRETRRVLRPGGIAVVSTPCFNVWLQRHAAQVTDGAERQRGEAPEGTPRGEFYQYAFTCDGMSTLLVALGFDVVQVHPYGALDTLMRYGGWRVPASLVNVLAIAMDHLPVIRYWGSTCIWVARKC